MLKYDFDVIHRAEKEHVIPDFLSRIYLTNKSAIKETDEDCCLAREKNKIFILFEDRSCLLKHSHRSYTGHLCTAKLFSFISHCFFWLGLYKDVKNMCASCLTCACIHLTMDYQQIKSGEAVYPFQLVSLNTGVITCGNDQKFCFVVAVDHFTHWVKVQVLAHETSEEIIQFILDFIIFRHGCLSKSQTDGGKPYVLDAIFRFCQSFGLQHTVTAAYHPQSNV